MAGVAEAKFSCDACGKSYKWKPEFAGRKVKCKCGNTMTAPAQPPEVENEPDLDALYTLADEGKKAAVAAPASIRCPSCHADLEPGEVTCPNCGFNLKTGKKAAPRSAGGTSAGASALRGGPAVATAGAPTGAAAVFQAYGTPRKGLQKDEVKDNALLDIYLPIGLLLFGLTVSVLQLTRFRIVTYPLSQAIMMTAIEFVISMALLAVGCLVAMRVAEVAFGAPGPAILKIAAISVAPTGVARICDYILGDPIGIVGLSLAFGAFFALFYYLFDMDQSEVWILTALTTAVRMFAATALMMALMNGAIGMPNLGLAAGKSDDDKLVKRMDDLGILKDGGVWIHERARQVGEFPDDESRKFIDDLYAAGAKKVLVRVEGPQALGVFVELPKDKARRKAVFDLHKEFFIKHKLTPGEDKGQTYLLMRFLPFEEPVEL